jgi:hypothetical protein
VTLRTRAGRTVRVLLLSRDQAENLWTARIAGADRLVLSPQQVFFGGDAIHLRAQGTPSFSLGVFPALGSAPRGSAALRSGGMDGMFARYTATLPPRPVRIGVTKTADAGLVPPVRLYNAVTWRKIEIALAPSDSAFERAARWRIDLPPDALAGKDDLFLDVRYAGDVARLYAGGELLDDNFFNGTTWTVGLRRYAAQLARGPLELRVLPLRSDAPVFIPAAYRPRSFPPSGQVAEVQSIDAVPEYELVVTPRPERR